MALEDLDEEMLALNDAALHQGEEGEGAEAKVEDDGVEIRLGRGGVVGDEVVHEEVIGAVEEEGGKEGGEDGLKLSLATREEPS